MIRDKKLLILVTVLAFVLLVLLFVAAFCIPKAKVPPVQTPPATTGPTVPPTRQEQTVGICLPARLEAWIGTGELLQKKLTALGYKTRLVYGDGTAKAQNQLLLELIENDISCIVLAPVDSAGMAEADTAALEKNIPIIAYGALLMDTEAVAGYVCYDYQAMGAELARYIEKKHTLSSAATEERSYTVELFMGSPEDYNAVLLHKGILSVLKPYLSAGVLDCKSHRTAFEDSCIYEWSGNAAEKACNSRLSSYPDSRPDILICASDSIAGGVLRSLEAAGVTVENMPLVTGNGATTEGLANLAAKKQAVTIQTDPEEPAEACCAMVDRLLLGLETEMALSTTFNNVTQIPTALCGYKLIEGE